MLDKRSLFEATAREILSTARPRLEDARVVLDGSGDRTFRRDFSARLRKEMNSSAERRFIRSVALRPSHQDNLLQLADDVAGVSARAISGKRDGEALRRAHLQAHEDSFRVWPV